MNYVFAQKYVLERHMKDKHNIHGDFTCSICGQSFHDARGLKFHNTVMHSANARYPFGRPKDKDRKDKLYHCDQCDKVTHSWIGLYQHKESVHQGVVYSCDQCTQIYRNAAGLRMHLQRVHGATLKYSCDGCSLKFYQASNTAGLFFGCFSGRIEGNGLSEKLSFDEFFEFWPKKSFSFCQIFSR